MSFNFYVKFILNHYIKHIFVIFMQKLDEQEIKGFGKYEDNVFHYTRYLDRIEIENGDIYNFRCFITIYKDGTFKFKTKGHDFQEMNQHLNLHYSDIYKKYDYSKKYDYYSVKNFMEESKSEKIKFSYLYKMLDDLFEIAEDDYIGNGPD